MRSIKTALFLVCIFILFETAYSHAQTVYVKDEFEITMRSGASIEHKIIAMLPTGTKLQVVEEKGDWILVKSPTDQEGWILKRYASVETPKKIVIEQLQKKYQEGSNHLGIETEKALKLEKENKDLRSALTSNQREFEKVTNDYTGLMNESKDFLKLKEEHASSLSNLRKARAELMQLTKENEELRSSTNITWLLSGAAVVIVSWLIGFVMAKISRRGRSNSLY